MNHMTENTPGSACMEALQLAGKIIMETMLGIYDRVVDPNLLIRRVNVVAADLIPEEEVPETEPEQLSLFTDYEEQAEQKKAAHAAEERERRLQQATLQIQEKYGKNAMLKGMNFLDGGTTIERNNTIGGHKAE